LLFNSILTTLKSFLFQATLCDYEPFRWLSVDRSSVLLIFHQLVSFPAQYRFIYEEIHFPALTKEFYLGKFLTFSLISLTFWQPPSPLPPESATHSITP
jgi:hypothetical protein